MAEVSNPQTEAYDSIITFQKSLHIRSISSYFTSEQQN
jgi:hypothetical protein